MRADTIEMSFYPTFIWVHQIFVLYLPKSLLYSPVKKIFEDLAIEIEYRSRQTV